MLFLNRSHNVERKKEQLKSRLYDVFAHDQLYSRTEAKSTVSTTRMVLNNAQSNIVPITPFLKRDCSKLEGVLV
ncbi:hypothetical protein [Fangia hongkongensis]|uniref:hypothetical protein n=1 Tax=Fangia hongkongensis TaxID=270495 RepID=UPI00035E81AF|nr:hypothetical protein [Fangia hongkongensis]MBK2125286.1 hypothetical protein [Fangia hongkongensis]